MGEITRWLRALLGAEKGTKPEERERIIVDM